MTDQLHDEWVLVIDGLRTISLATTKTNSIVLTVEDPQSIAIVEVPAEDARELCDELTRRLKGVR